jgi:hypothetical protein
MEEELHLLRELYVTAARKNLAEEAFWNNMSVKHGFVPEVLPPGMLELSRLSSLEYSPDLRGTPDDRYINVWLFSIFFFWEVR